MYLSDREESACNAGDPGPIPWSGRSPGRGTGTHSSILAWRIPWTEEPGKLQSMGCTESDTTEATQPILEFKLQKVAQPSLEFKLQKVANINYEYTSNNCKGKVQENEHS